MLANTLVTNEVKDAAAAEVEFVRLQTEGRKTVFAKVDESPALPHRLTVSHVESGNGVRKIRRSMVRVDITSISTVDSVTPVVSSFYIVGQIPIGGLTAMTIPKNALAELTSFVATNASSTHLYDGTGTGAAALLSGSL